MAIVTRQVAVSTMPMLVATADDGWVHLSAIHRNVSFVILGGADVSLANGFFVMLGPQPFSLQLKAGDNLWALARTPTETTIISVLQHKKV